MCAERTSVSEQRQLDEARPPKSVLEDDTNYPPSVVFERRGSKSRKNVGTVTVRTMNLNQRGVADISFWRIAGIDQRHEGRSVRDKGRTEDGL